jgi:hypothetical protein
MIALIILSVAMIYLVIGSLIVKHIANKWGKGIAIAILILIPTGDAIVGQVSHIYLCSTEERVKVYQTVVLPAEYWDKKGAPKFFGAYGFVDMKLLPNKFEWHSVNEPYIDSVIKIEKWRSQLRDKETQDILGERISYVRFFGWMNRFSPAPNVAESCRDIWGVWRDINRDEFSRKELEQDQAFFLNIFKPATSTR